MGDRRTNSVRRRRALLALVAAPILALACATPSPAKTYTFHSCDRASGANGSSAGWTTNGSTDRRSAAAYCETHGQLLLRFFSPGPFAPGLRAEAEWTAPAGLTIDSIRYRRYHDYFGKTAGGPYTGHNAWYIDVARAGRYTGLEDCVNFAGAYCPGGGAADKYYSALNARSFRAAIHCWDAVPNPGCDQPHPGAPGPLLSFEWLKFGLSDTTSPTVGRVTGEVSEQRRHAGIETLFADLSDVGSGLYRQTVRLDGEVIGQAVVDGNGGACRDADPDNTDVYEFEAPVPCKLAHQAAIPVDLRQAEEGPRQLDVRVEDAAGNERVVFADDAFVVDNVTDAVAEVAPTVSGAAQVGRTLTAAAGRWTNALGEPAWQWMRCDSLGAACAPITGADEEQYVVAGEDVGRRLRVRVDRVNAASESSSAASSPTEPVERTGGSSAAADGMPGADGAAGPSGPAGGSTTTTSTLLVPNGAPAARDARLTLAFTRGGSAAQTVRWGRGATVAGRLTDATGTPIRGALVSVVETPALPGAKPAATTTVTTDADGRFTRRIARTASSRTIRATYAADRGGPVVAEAQVRLAVTAAVKLAVTLKGVVVRYTGRVLSGPLPAGGKLVIVQGRVRGGSWQTFATRRATRGGAFGGRYRLRARTPGRVLQFRARVVAESGYAYRPATSRAVSRTVR